MGDPQPSQPLVSVITSVFNGEKYLPEAIESVLAQTHSNFEYLILDDGSTDESKAIAQRYADRDARITLLSHPNMGVAATENRGLTAAHGHWVAILDHDDIWLPRRLELQLAAARARPNVKVWGSYAWRIAPDGHRARQLRIGPTTENEFRRIRASNEVLPVIHSTVLMHRETVVSLGGYDLNLHGASDPDLWSRVADSHMIQVIPKPLIEYRMHASSIMATRMLELERYHRWIEMRQLYRRMGCTMPDYATFLALESSQPYVKRARIWRQDRGTVAIRRAQLEWLSGNRGRSLCYACLGTALNPIRLAKRVRSVVRR